MDTKIIREEMNRLDKISGLDTSQVPIRISSKMTRAWGKCCWKRKGQRYYIKELVFAKRLMEYGTMEHIINVIRHEYAHLFVTEVHNKNHGMMQSGSGPRCGWDAMPSAVKILRRSTIWTTVSNTK